MSWLFIETSWDLILKYLPYGGGPGAPPGTALIENTRTNMTSDGISSNDWDEVEAYAAKIAETSEIEDGDSAALTAALLRYLDNLEVKYGARPSILATKADYVTDPCQRANLLRRAHNLAAGSYDLCNMLLTASSLAEFYIEENVNVPLAELWLAKFGECLARNWDDLEHKEFVRLTEQLKAISETEGPRLS